MRLRRSLALALLALAAVSAAPFAHAQSASGDERGYVAPRLVEGWFDEPPTVEVNLSGTLLRMVTAGLSEDAEDEERRRAAAVLKRLSGLYVRIYEPETPVPMETLGQRADALTERLGRAGWETVVRVREPEEHVSVQLRPRGADAVAGLVVLVTGADGEHVFVNLVGDISPEDVGEIAGSFDGLGRLKGLDGLGNN